mgnify:FL=1
MRSCLRFSILFSNSVLFGLPITEIVYGKESIGANLAIISIHAPLCYFIGIAAMEIFTRAKPYFLQTFLSIFRSIFSNMISVSLLLGLLFNLANIQLFAPLLKTFELISVGAIPLALFGMGGVLVRYKLASHIGKVSLILVCSLLLHPLLIF